MQEKTPENDLLTFIRYFQPDRKISQEQLDAIKKVSDKKPGEMCSYEIYQKYDRPSSLKCLWNALGSSLVR